MSFMLHCRTNYCLMSLYCGEVMLEKGVYVCVCVCDRTLD